MFDDLDCDSLDDLLLPPVTAKDRSSSKFRPKARSKPVKVAAATPKTSDSAGIVPAPPESVAPDLDANHELAQASFLPSVSNSSTVGYEHQSMQKSEQQPEVIQAESVESRGEFIQHPEQNKKNLVQDVDLCFSMNSPNRLIMSTGSGSLDDYQSRALPQSENRELMMSPVVVPEVEESFCASILTSSYSQSEPLHTEVNEAQLPLQPEEVISQEASQGGVYAQDGDIDMQSNLDQSKQVSAELPNVESPTGLFPCGTTDVTQIGRFQPKKGKLCNKEAKPKSVSFILPDASHSAAPMESCPGKMDSSSMQVMNDRPIDNPLSSSNTNSDWSRELQVDHGRMEYENGQDNGLPKILEDVHMKPQSQDVQELEQQILDDRTSTENADDDGASISSRTMRKSRITKNKTGEIESRSNDSSGTDNLHVSEEINGSQSDERHGDEDIPRPKRAKRKPKKQTTEIEKPARRSKEVSEKSNSAVRNSPKKKLPHATRRKRRQVDKVLLQTPEEEIDPRQISIKNLIMLAEAKERMQAKEGAPMSKLFSNHSSSSLSNNENTLFGEDENMLFGEDEEWNHRGEEENHNIQQAPKKLNYHTYMKRSPSGRWSKSEIELLYEAIRQFGSDFAMIQQLFPNRTRHQIKLKFKIEERKHPSQVHDALLHRSKDLSHVMQVIKQLQTRPEPTSNGEENSDQMNTLQIGNDEEETGGNQIDEEQQQYDREGEEDKGPEEFIDSKDGVNTPDAKDDGSFYDCDTGAYTQDGEEDSMWVI